MFILKVWSVVDVRHFFSGVRPHVEELYSFAQLLLLLLLNFEYTEMQLDAWTDRPPRMARA